MKKHKYFGIFITIGLSIIILTAGTFLASWIDALVPSYKNQITEAVDTNSNNKIFQFNKQDELQLYPWNYYVEKRQPSLTQAQKELLLQKKVPDFIFAMLDITQVDNSERSAFVNQFELLSVPIQNAKYFVLKNIKVGNSDFYINCAVTQGGEIVSCYASHGTEKLTDSALEKAQAALQDNLTNKSPNLSNYIKRTMSISNKFDQMQIGRLLENENILKIQANSKPEIIPTGNLILLNYKTDNSIHLIFYFNPNTLTFCGFHMQQSQ